MRKTFLLGGSPFTAPDPIGAGVRARIAQITADIADEKKVPNNTDLVKRYYYDYSLRLLEIILTPEREDSLNDPKQRISIRDAYDLATDEEVQAVMDFFALSASGKTKSGSGKTGGSGNSKRIQKPKL